MEPRYPKIGLTLEETKKKIEEVIGAELKNDRTIYHYTPADNREYADHNFFLNDGMEVRITTADNIVTRYIIFDWEEKKFNYDTNQDRIRIAYLGDMWIDMTNEVVIAPGRTAKDGLVAYVNSKNLYVTNEDCLLPEVLERFWYNN